MYGTGVCARTWRLGKIARGTSAKLEVGKRKEMGNNKNKKLNISFVGTRTIFNCMHNKTEFTFLVHNNNGKRQLFQKWIMLAPEAQFLLKKS